MSLLFENTGNVHYKPLLGAVLKGEDGRVLKEVEPTQVGKSILPTISRLFLVDLGSKGNLSPGKYTVEGRVNLEDGTLLDSKEMEFEV